MLNKTEKIWMDGKFVNWDDAKVHVLTHTLHYGLGHLKGYAVIRQRRVPLSSGLTNM